MSGICLGLTVVLYILYKYIYKYKLLYIAFWAIAACLWVPTLPKHFLFSVWISWWIHSCFCLMKANSCNMQELWPLNKNYCTCASSVVCGLHVTWLGGKYFQTTQTRRTFFLCQCDTFWVWKLCWFCEPHRWHILSNLITFWLNVLNLSPGHNFQFTGTDLISTDSRVRAVRKNVNLETNRQTCWPCEPPKQHQRHFQSNLITFFSPLLNVAFLNLSPGHGFSDLNCS